MTNDKKKTSGATAAVAGAMYFLFLAFRLGGTAYIVFWRGHSGWWFVPAIGLALSLRVPSCAWRRRSSWGSA